MLGLSVTPTTVGWVLAEGHGAEGTILHHRELQLCAGRGVRAVNTAEQVAAEVRRATATATADNHRVRVIGVTWSDDASAPAALLLESLTDAGFDNVVPVRSFDAVETLAQAIAPIIGYEQTAVCILEHERATVIMVDIRDGVTQTAVKRVRGGFDVLTSWLTGMFDRSAWCPGSVVIIGSDHDINSLSWDLEKVLPVPVFAQIMAQVTVARGAALVAAQSTEFTDKELVADASEATSVAARSRQLSYTGAVTTLAVAVITFVASLSLTVELKLVSDKDPGTSTPTVHQSATPYIAEAVMPPPAEVLPLAPVAAPRPAVEEKQPARFASDGSITEQNPPQEQPSSAAPQEDPNGHPPLLTRVLEHIPGGYGDSTPHPWNVVP